MKTEYYTCDMCGKNMEEPKYTLNKTHKRFIVTRGNQLPATVFHFDKLECLVEHVTKVEPNPIYRKSRNVLMLETEERIK